MNTQPRIQNVFTDSNGDGIQDSFTTLILDADGNQIAKYVDSDLDGKADYSLTSVYEYDDAGNLTITYSADNDGDGVIDIELPYVFDTRGVQLNQSGRFGSSQDNPNTDYAYDDAGNLVLVENRSSDTATRFTYDDSGRLITTTRRSILTGELKFESTSQYNERGDISRSTIDFDGDGVDDAFVAAPDVLLLGNLFSGNGSGVDQNPADIFLQLLSVNGEAVDSPGREITLASGALLRVRPNGDFVYNPTEAFSALETDERATDSFTYSVVNSVGQTDAATVVLTVEGVSSLGNPSLLRQEVGDTNGDSFPERIVTYT